MPLDTPVLPPAAQVAEANALAARERDTLQQRMFQQAVSQRFENEMMQNLAQSARVDQQLKGIAAAKKFIGLRGLGRAIESGVPLDKALPMFPDAWMDTSSGLNAVSRIVREASLPPVDPSKAIPVSVGGRQVGYSAPIGRDRFSFRPTEPTASQDTARLGLQSRALNQQLGSVSDAMAFATPAEKARLSTVQSNLLVNLSNLNERIAGPLVAPPAEVAPEATPPGALAPTRYRWDPVAKKSVPIK